MNGYTLVPAALDALDDPIFNADYDILGLAMAAQKGIMEVNIPALEGLLDRYLEDGDIPYWVETFCRDVIEKRSVSEEIRSRYLAALGLFCA